jgi:hypothetical protein
MSKMSGRRASRHKRVLYHSGRCASHALPHSTIMAAVKRTAAEEAAFMTELLSGLDNSVFDHIPSPVPSPRKSPSKRPRSKSVSRSPLASRLPNPNRPLAQRTPSKRKSPRKSHSGSAAQNAVEVKHVELDLAVLTAGAEDWDWGDMLTPKKNKSPKKCHRNKHAVCIPKSISRLFRIERLLTGVRVQTPRARAIHLRKLYARRMHAVHR